MWRQVHRRSKLLESQWSVGLLVDCATIYQLLSSFSAGPEWTGLLQVA